jgi:hypothetical protein
VLSAIQRSDSERGIRLRVARETNGEEMRTKSVEEA